MKNVLYIIDCLYENAGGGSEKQFLKLYDNLEEINVVPYVVFLKDQAVHEKLEWKNRPYVVDFSGFMSPLFLLNLWKILRYIKKYEITIVHSLFDDSTIIAGIIKLIRRDLTLIVSHRNIGHSRTWLRKKLISTACRISDQVAVNSKIITNFLVNDYGVEKSKIMVIENIFESNLSESCEDAISFINGIKIKFDYIGVVVSNLREIKGIDDLINAAEMMSKDLKVAIIVIGGGNDYDKYVNIVKEKKLDKKIHIMGYRNDIHCFLDNVDFAILPSRSEGASNSLIEYIFYELPTVATRVGGNSESLDDGKCGILVSPCNATELASGIETICQNLDSYRKLSIKLKDMVMIKYSMKSVISKYKHLYWNSTK